MITSAIASPWVGRVCSSRVIIPLAWRRLTGWLNFSLVDGSWKLNAPMACLSCMRLICSLNSMSTVNGIVTGPGLRIRSVVGAAGPVPSGMLLLLSPFLEVGDAGVDALDVRRGIGLGQVGDPLLAELHPGFHADR